MLHLYLLSLHLMKNCSYKREEMLMNSLIITSGTILIRITNLVMVGEFSSSSLSF